MKSTPTQHHSLLVRQAQRYTRVSPVQEAESLLELQADRYRRVTPQDGV